MKLTKFLALAIAIIPMSMNAQYQWIEKKSPDGKYSYKTVSNDPTETRFYTLKNGLTVILSVNKATPRIQTYIATKAGSKNDPHDNTGLAHYLEHMLFKGTDKYGSKDWAKEKVLLDKIDDLYEKYNQTKDAAQRKKIYHEIDSTSGEASKYAIANEYDKMAQIVGAKGTNAFTSVEQTVYVNDIPSNQINKWLTIEAERFRNPILRLFHTELEAVYEEKNRTLDNDNRKVFEKLMEGMFTQHTYGTQTTIGTVEHLKNPSLKKIRNYFNTWYVPNNMAIILSGDFDADKTIEMIDKHFSFMQKKDLPSFTWGKEPVNSQPKTYEVFGPEAERIMIGYRLPGANTREVTLLELTDLILSNSKAGLIDLNLVKKQKVQSATSSPDIMKDYSMHTLSGQPKTGQTLDELKALLMEQLDMIKKGNFDEALIKSIIANRRVEMMQQNEENRGRAANMLDAFVLGSDWKEVVSHLDEMSKITKKEIVDFANKYYTNDYVVVYKRKGEDKTTVKVDKPEIHPVTVNREDRSDFLKMIADMPAPTVSPEFINYDKDIQKGMLNGNVPVYYVKNNENKLFSLYYVLDMGKNHDKKLPVALGLLQFLGTDKYSADDISKEFYKLACNFGVSSSDEQVLVYLNGLEENFDAGVKLFEHLLANCKPDQSAMDKLVESILKSRQNAKLNKGVILQQALQNYAKFGKNNPFTNNLSEAELKGLKAEDMVSVLKSLCSYKHKVFYYGSREMGSLTSSLSAMHKTNSTLKDYPTPVQFTRVENTENTVYFTEYKMVQAEIMWVNKSMQYNAQQQPTVALFNEYFGGGMSSIVFQTIRESKALAYSSYSRYASPQKANDPYYIIAYVGTQADKLNDAIPAMNELLNDMPKTEKAFENARLSVRNGIETDRVRKMSLIFNYDNAQKMGLDHDIRADVYQKSATLSYDDISKFFNNNYKGKPFSYCIVGSKEKIKTADLAKFGKVVELNLEEIFGY